MQSRRLIRLLSLLALLVCPTTNTKSQTTISGALNGVVTDQSGAVIIEAEIHLQNLSKGTSQTAKTDRDGVYQLPFLLPGKYQMRVSHSGFREQSCELDVVLGPAGTRNITLTVAGGSTTVKVSGEAPMLQAENGDASTTISQKQVSEVPNPGNDLTYIAQTAPGAIMNTDTLEVGYVGNVSILGMPGSSNLYTVNGMNDNVTFLNTNASGALGMMLGQNEVEEASIVNNGYSAQFGGAAGSNINYVTKSGGNAFHGNLEWYWNGRALNANDWISNARGIPRPFDIANQWAGSLGGPILKDKLFFFFDTEGMRLVLPQPSYVLLPTRAFETATMSNIDSLFGQASATHKFYQQIFDLYNSTPGASQGRPGSFVDPLGCNGWTNPNDPNDPQGLGVGTPCATHFIENLYHPASESIVSGRVDWNIGNSDRLFFLAQYDHGQRTASIDPINSAFDGLIHVPWWQGQLSETHTISGTAANQFLLAGTYAFPTQSVADPAKAKALFPTTLVWCNAGCPFSNLGGNDFGDGMLTGNKAASYQISDDLTKTTGKHKLGIGLSFLRSYLTGGGFNWSGTGQIVPQTINAFFYGGVAPKNPNEDFTTLFQTYPVVTWNRINFYSLGLYGQDEWRVRPNLTLTFALRGDHQSNPVCESRCFARFASSFDQMNHSLNQPYDEAILTNQKQAFAETDSIVWSPRFSFAWQPLGIFHSVALRGGMGIFHDPLPGLLGVIQSTNFPLINTYTITGYNLAPEEVNSLTKVAESSNETLLKGFAAGQTLAQMQAIDSNFSPPAFFNAPHVVHPPQYQKWSLQAQKSFGASTSLMIGYFGNHGIHEFFQNVNANAHSFGSYPSQACGNQAVAPCYDSRFGQVQQFGTGAISNYNGMVVSFEKRVSHFGTGMLQVNYTYGHALDEVSNGGLIQFASGSNISPQDPTHLRGSYGAADYDARHSVNANYIWEIPFKDILRGHGPAALVQGWQVSGTVIARTGFPYTAFDFSEGGSLVNDNIFGPIYSVPVARLGPQASCGKGAVEPSAPVPCLPSQVLGDGSSNPGALFVQTGCETGFNTGHLGASGVCDGPLVSFAQGRNRFRGPAYVTTDLAIMKNTGIPHWENGVLTLGLQFFNLFNHPNFGFPDIASSDPTFGRIFYEEQPPTSVLGSGLNANVSARMIQVRAQLRF